MDKFASHLWMILDVVGVKYSDRKVLYVLRIFFLKKIVFSHLWLVFENFYTLVSAWFSAMVIPWCNGLFAFCSLYLYLFCFDLRNLDCVVSSLHSNYVDASFGI